MFVNPITLNVILNNEAFVQIFDTNSSPSLHCGCDGKPPPPPPPEEPPPPLETAFTVIVTFGYDTIKLFEVSIADAIVRFHIFSLEVSSPSKRVILQIYLFVF